KAFGELLADVVESKLGERPDYSTTGGTSDARFIKNICPVAEYGLVGQTMHKVDERVDINDLNNLVDIYVAIVNRFFEAG
ncbi:MAG: M20/M25/M40 family metallo-hydrolase, partial [Alphaproteobacteria bacterium]